MSSRSTDGRIHQLWGDTGDPVTGNWEIRQLSKTDRIRKFAPVAVLEIAGSFMLQLGADIDAHRALEGPR
ncbi:hypothetical protein ACSDR0_31355 [Streptosporangium sp. G11]|uniref:hypothetical protein n=1 Tax=Streptosporangium sp. G11 TaxID=3436926 RepID=UPI003EBDE1F8